MLVKGKRIRKRIGVGFEHIAPLLSHPLCIFRRICAYSMVSFTCSVCQDVVKKPKVIGHANGCRGASFVCVDCMEVFDLETVRGHTSCVTEVEKYQGRWQRNGSATERKGHMGVTRAREVSSDSNSDDESWVRQKKAAPTHGVVVPPSRNGDGCRKKQPRLESFALPPSVSEEVAEYTVPGFVLGSSEEVAKVARWVLEDAAPESLSVREVARRLVGYYEARIARQLRGTVESLIRRGELRLEGGVVVSP
ncbi:RNA binding protein, putative [Trypanosoma congolense IL3000]|uniref:RNA binding protein, putative n=1 Tax=Trypanosoma congolense (strain IL3000) TaxID=1068625 RepID=F9W700_TRYCI|nr:RNA binding protein, putative [Trypanosoma congolense IL3000]